VSDRVSALLDRRSGAPGTRRIRFPILLQLLLTVTSIVAIVLSVTVVLWVLSETNTVRRQLQREAQTLATAMADAWGNELIDENWNQIRYQIGATMERNQDFVYFMVSDTRRGGRVIAASPNDVIGQFVPDVAPAELTDRALLAEDEEPAITETWILREIRVGHEEEPRALPGDPIIEAASPVTFEGNRVGVLRVGVSMRRVDEARRVILEDALTAGALCFLVGIVIAWLVARRLTAPVRALEVSASRMASGDLAHRSEVSVLNEIGALSREFNRMADALDKSFKRLRGTLASFERFVPRKFLLVVAPEGIENIQIGSRAERTITILFSDIRGYTSISESSTPEEMFNLLNEYLPEMGEAIDSNGGFVDKYIGDAIMALFDEAHTDGALSAARDMRERLASLNTRREAAGKQRFDIGIGLHRGTVIMGTVGFKSKIESTVIGDAVNAASRVEGLTKQYHVHVLVTEAVVDALQHPDRFALRVVDQAAKIRGKDEPIKLYTIDPPDAP
jgi:adenylate cyclase